MPEGTSVSSGWRAEAAGTLRLLAQWLDDGEDIEVTGWRDISMSSDIYEFHCKIKVSEHAYFVRGAIPPPKVI